MTHESDEISRPAPSENDALVVLCDETGAPSGTMPKLEAHQPPGRLHLAFSVFVFDSEGRLLLQRRAHGKYHFAGLWTNTCCSHPGPEQPIVEAGERRLREEMGLAVPLRVGAQFVYRAEDLASGLVEHEHDTVLVGESEGEPTLNPAEADEWRWVDIPRLREELRAQPKSFTPWFGRALDAALVAFGSA